MSTTPVGGDTGGIAGTQEAQPADPMQGYQANVTSDNASMAQNLDSMIKQQMYVSQLTTTYQLESQMIKDLFDTMKSMIRNMD
jgi:hypothetical protein